MSEYLHVEKPFLQGTGNKEPGGTGNEEPGTVITK